MHHTLVEETLNKFQNMSKWNNKNKTGKKSLWHQTTRSCWPNYKVLCIAKSIKGPGATSPGQSVVRLLIWYPWCKPGLPAPPHRPQCFLARLLGAEILTLLIPSHSTLISPGKITVWGQEINKRSFVKREERSMKLCIVWWIVRPFNLVSLKYF